MHRKHIETRSDMLASSTLWPYAIFCVHCPLQNLRQFTTFGPQYLKCFLERRRTSKVIFEYVMHRHLPQLRSPQKKIQFICKIVRWVRGSWEGCRAGSWCDRSRTERSSCPARWSSWRRWSRDRRHCWARIRSWFPGGRRWPCSLSCRCWNDKELRKYVKVSILSHLHPLQNVHDFIFLIHYVNFSLKARSQGLCKMQ